MSRQVRVSQKQITDSKSFSVPLHLFVWVTVGSMLEWFHQKLNSCLTGLICLHYCEKKHASEYFYYTNTNLYCFDASKMRTVSLFQTAVRSTVWRACLSIIFFFFVAKQHLCLTAQPPWVGLLYEWKLKSAWVPSLCFEWRQMSTQCWRLSS